MTELGYLLEAWTEATMKVKPGVQRVFHDTFQAAKDGDTHLVYGTDYRDGYPCLVNTVGTMLTTGGGHGVPSSHFGEIVSLFDQINREFESNGVNDERGFVSPLAAEIFLKHFAELKPMPEGETVDTTVDGLPYYEPSDEDMAKALVELMSGETQPCGEVHYVTDRESMDFMMAVKPESRPAPDFVVSEDGGSEPPC